MAFARGVCRKAAAVDGQAAAVERRVLARQAHHAAVDAQRSAVKCVHGIILRIDRQRAVALDFLRGAAGIDRQGTVLHQIDRPCGQGCIVAEDQMDRFIISCVNIIVGDVAAHHIPLAVLKHGKSRADRLVIRAGLYRAVGVQIVHGRHRKLQLVAFLHDVVGAVVTGEVRRIVLCLGGSGAVREHAALLHAYADVRFLVQRVDNGDDRVTVAGVIGPQPDVGRLAFGIGIVLIGIVLDDDLAGDQHHTGFAAGFGICFIGIPAGDIHAAAPPCRIFGDAAAGHGENSEARYIYAAAITAGCVAGDAAAVHDKAAHAH